MGLLDRAGLNGDGADPRGNGTPPGLPVSVRAEILRYPSGSPFCGVIFERPGGEEAGADFRRRFSHVTAFFGTHIPLSNRRSLLLFPKSLDRDLIVHRLSRSLTLKAVAVFEADSPGEAAAKVSGCL
jgi:hypothetical protein